MRKILLLILVLLVGLPARSLTDKELAYGTMRPLEITAIPGWEEGFRPVHAWHLGRHGARYLSSERKLEQLTLWLRKAQAQGMLTAKGEQVLALRDSVVRECDGRWGYLTPLGERQEREIGEATMRSMGWDTVPANDLHWKAFSTVVPRCVNTMYQFCLSVSREAEEGEVTSDNRRYSDPLRFFATDSAYAEFLKGEWLKDLTDSEIEGYMPTASAEALFLPGFEIKRSALQNVQLDLYTLLTCLPAMGDWRDYSHLMTLEEMLQTWNVTNTVRRCGRTSSVSPIPVEAGARAMKEIFHPDLNVVGGTGYYAHAETLMPILDLLEIPGCGGHDPWLDSKVVPLGAYLQVQWALRNGEMWARVIHNGKIVEGPVRARELEKKWTELINNQLQGL